jgi:hypothetical protein
VFGFLINVELKGRFEPVAVSKWLGEHTINVPSMHVGHTGAGAVHKK